MTTSTARITIFLRFIVVLELTGSLTVATSGRATRHRNSLNLLPRPRRKSNISNRQGIQAKEPGDAVHLLEATAPYELGQNADFIPIYLRGQAYFLARSGTEASREFQKIIDHRGVDPESPLVALAHLGEARSYALTGDVPQSRRSYEEFFTLWKDADPELSVLKKARDECAKLVH
jgi:hypothetical protein